MDFKISEEQQMLLDSINKFAEREKFKELAVKIDKENKFPEEELHPKYAALGLYGMTISPEYGGGGQPALSAVLAVEELAKYSIAMAAAVFENNLGPCRILETYGTEEQKKRLLPGICEGKYCLSIGMTEPGGGSDLAALKTKGVDKGDHYLLNGTKCFISGGGSSSHFLVFTRLSEDRGFRSIGAVIVEDGMPGFSHGPQEDFLGWRGVPSAELVFEDVKIPKENVVIEAGGFAKLLGGFALERLGNSACSVGTAEGALREAMAYVTEREAFGKQIIEFQTVQFHIVDIKMQIDAARMLLYRAASNAGMLFPDPFEAAMAKCYCNAMAVEATNRALQIFGGYGYSKEFPMERYLRDARGCGIAGGTQEMLKLTQARFLFGRMFDQRK